MTIPEGVPLPKKPTGARWRGAVGLATLLALIGGARVEARAASPEARAVIRVCAAGPEAGVAQAIRRGGAAEVDASEVLPNPSLVLQHQQTLEGPEERETVVGLSVPLGLGGRRFVLQDAAEARRAASEASSDALLVGAAIDVQEAIAAAALDERRAAVLLEMQAAHEALDGMLAALTRGGEAPAHDRKRQRIQARLHRARLEEAQARAASSADLVASLLGAPAAGLEPSLLSTSTSAAASGAPPPHVLALEAEARAHGLEATAAERGWVPDVDLFAGYRNVGAGGAIGHGVSLGLTIPITFFDRGQGEAGRASAEEEIARARLAGERIRVGRVERAATARLDRLLATLGEVKAAEREAGEIAASARELYAAGESSLTELLAAYQAHEDARLASLGRLEAIAIARVEVMRARGGLLDAALERACIAAARGDRP
jgi:outer membrane protein TolC